MFIFLDKKIGEVNSFLKRKTTLDFCSWAIFLLSILLVCVFQQILGNEELKDKVNIYVISFTGIVVLIYTKETHDLKEVNIKQYNFQRAPFIISNFDKQESFFYLKNVGNGLARNVKMAPIISPLDSNKILTFLNKTVVVPDKAGTIVLDNLGKPVTGLVLMEFLKAAKSAGLPGLKIQINYYDAYNTNYSTTQLFKELDDSSEIISYQ